MGGGARAVDIDNCQKERGMRARQWRIGGLALSMMAMMAIAFGDVAQAKDEDHASDRDGNARRLSGWRVAGGDLNNSRSQLTDEKIDPRNVGTLVPKWMFTTGGDVSATPTVAGNAVYFPDWAGNLYAVRAHTGKLLWSHQIAEYNGRPGSVSRVSPAIYNDELIVGDNVSLAAQHDGAHVMAVDRHSGTLRWITQVDAHPAAIITGSPVFHGRTVYVGVSSNEESLAANPAYPCCTFRGSMVALDAITGAILWKTYVVPDNGGLTNGYSGNAIWSPPAIDPERGVLFTATGNNYTVPPDVERCQEEAIGNGTNDADCTAPDDFFDTVLAMDLTTGAIKWARRLSGYDAWNVACVVPPARVNCPSPSGPDFDFPGSGPNLVGNILGVGQKSGIFWALNPASGHVIWSTVVGPGGLGGGIQWGHATDGKRFYVQITNSSHQPHTLANGGPTITWGSWAALDVKTGRIIWQIGDPTPGAVDSGAVSVANGVMFAASSSGAMYALKASTGAVLFSFPSGGTVIDAPSIVNGTVFWGSGYRKSGIGNNKVYAFSPP